MCICVTEVSVYEILHLYFSDKHLQKLKTKMDIFTTLLKEIK